MLNIQSEHRPENALKIALMVLLVALVCIVALPFLIVRSIIGIYLRFRFLGSALREGRFVLLVYSDSPHWKSYFEQNILPRVQDHAIILNWSERSRWKSTSWVVQAFHHWGGSEDFNPMTIVFCNLLKIRIFRFYRAFQDYKRGKTAPLEGLEADFLQLFTILS